MANTREIRRRIKSIKNTAQITKAMQMVAASKMRKAQQAALTSRPYAELLNKMMRSAAARVNLSAHPLVAPREVKNLGVLLVSTNRGLCGSLNSNLFRVLTAYDTATTSFVTAGIKGRSFVSRTKRTLLADFEITDSFSFADARAIARHLMELYTEKKVDRVEVLYTNYVNTMTQRPERVQLLPISENTALPVELEDSKQEAEMAKGPEPEIADYEYEPDATEVLSAILPHYVNFAVWHFLLESKASEHSARMVAMKSATDNALQLVKDLTLEYNKIRQAGITNELLEIATAQMAMG